MIVNLDTVPNKTLKAFDDIEYHRYLGHIRICGSYDQKEEGTILS